MRSVLVVLALWDAGAAADLAALAPFAPEEHAPAVKRSAERAAKASRLVADHGHLLPPDLREKAHDLLNEHDFRVHAALDSARPGPALAPAADEAVTRGVSPPGLRPPVLAP